MTALNQATLRNGLAHPSSLSLDVVVSPKARALRVMNTLIMALDERGLPVEVRVVVQQRPVKYDENASSTRVLVTGEWIRRERRVTFVTEQLQHWRDARDLRALEAEVRARLRAENLPAPKWLAWASGYAGELDPVKTL